MSILLRPHKVTKGHTECNLNKFHTRFLRSSYDQRLISYAIKGASQSCQWEARRLRLYTLSRSKAPIDNFSRRATITSKLFEQKMISNVNQDFLSFKLARFFSRPVTVNEDIVDEPGPRR